MGAAASGTTSHSTWLPAGFKPHQRGGGCCSTTEIQAEGKYTLKFQTPSAGRWVLQLGGDLIDIAIEERSFKPHQRGGGCCSWVVKRELENAEVEFQTPSAGRWVLQLPAVVIVSAEEQAFQTPSAGRWVLQPMATMWTTG